MKPQGTMVGPDFDSVGLRESGLGPWALAFSPDGKHLLAIGTLTGTLQIFRISENGDLKLASKHEWGDKVTDLVTR